MELVSFRGEIESVAESVISSFQRLLDANIRKVENEVARYLAATPLYFPIEQLYPFSSDV